MDHAALLRLKDSAADIDLNSKMTHVQLRRERRRITWIRFHLSREQKWPTWATPSDSNSDEATYLGPLAGLEGCEKVWLGRLVADPEKAALIVLWESVPVLEEFEASTLCGELLRDLGCDSDERRLVSFRWTVGFWFEEGLYGRVTRTTLIVPYSGLPEYEAWQSTMFRHFRGFMPAGCEKFRRSLPRAFPYQAFAWVDTARQALALKEAGERNAPLSSPSGEQRGVGDHEKAVGYHFFRWNGNDAAPEREDAANVDPKAKESWEQMVAKMTPPVGTWEQERWDLELAPCYPVETFEDDQASSDDE